MYALSRSVAVLLASIFGFIISAGVFVAGTMIFLDTFKVRDLEENDVVDIPDDKFFGKNPEVDLLDLTMLELYDELTLANSMEGGLSISLMQSRYSLIINERLDAILSDEAKAMPISKLITDEGVHTLLSTVYVGNVEKYECHKIDSDEKADPADGPENTRWYDTNKKEYVTGISATIAYFTLEDFSNGNINVDSVLDGVVLHEIFGYKSQVDANGKTEWYDGDGNKITGVLAVLADCKLDDVNEKINNVNIGELIGYELRDDGNWYEEGAVEPVQPFMSAVANRSINTIGNLYDTLYVTDLVAVEDREGTIFELLPDDTKLNGISDAVSDTIKNSPLQFFITNGMIEFATSQTVILDNKDSKVSVSPADYEKYYDFEGNTWTKDASGNYLIPKWRTVSLSDSFSHIISVISQP